MQQKSRLGNSIKCYEPFILCAGLWFYAVSAWGSNGLNLIGFGAESMGFAGADVAAVDDTYALTINPAGLSAIENRHIDMYAAASYALDIGHKDQFGNDTEVDNKLLPLGNFAYGQRHARTPITLGFGFVAQGGAGVEYNSLRTAFGTTDRLISLIRVAKFNLGIAYELAPPTSVGIALTGIYSDAEQEFFPDTSSFTGTLATSFFGYKLKDLQGFSASVKIGLKHRLHDSLVLGLAFAPETALELDGGYLVSNQSAVGNGNVTYRDVRLEGLKLPNELNVGLLWQASDVWDLSTELTWLDWSKAMHSQTLTASNPENGAAPPVLQQTALNEWRDQYVIAIAVQRHYGPDLALRAGYNYGRNPIPAHRLSPVLNNSAQHHFTLGSSHVFDHAWQLHTAVEYIAKERITYTNPDLPFGNNAEERGEAISFHITVSHNW